MKCPKCGSGMILRTASRGFNAGNKFYGCKKFPACRGTVDFKEKADKKKKEKVETTKKKTKTINSKETEMIKAKGFENSSPIEEPKKEYSSERKENVKKTLEDLRLKLLDLTGKNPLVSFKHRETNKNQVRLIDEIIDILYQKLNDNKPLQFLSLPEPDNNPKDEKTEKFLNELEIAKVEDEIYLEALSKLPDDDDGLSKKSQIILRELKDRLREKLGMEMRRSPDVMSKKEYAIKCKLDPSYEMPTLIDGKNKSKWMDKKMQTLLFDDELFKNLETIRRKYRESYDEKGINTLHIVFGFLEWYEDKNSEKKIFSPILIQPIDLERIRKPKGFVYSIETSGEPAKLNLTLVERLKRDFNINLPEFAEEDKPEEYFKKIEKVISNQQNWNVRKFVTIGHFQYLNILMYQDLDVNSWPNADDLLGSEIINEIAFGSSNDSLGYQEDYEIDNEDIQKVAPYLILDSDSSQHSAVVDVLQNKNLVLKGPPGTGKSQTIANIVGAALAQGKKILFVSAKAAALDVVYKRLNDVGLGEFCLRLHAYNSKRKQVVEDLKRRLDKTRKRSPEEFDQNVIELKRNRNKLNAYVNDVNKNFGSTGLTIQEIFWAAINNQQYCEDGMHILKKLYLPDCENISQIQIEDACSRLDMVKIILEKFNDKFAGITNHPFYGLNNYKLSKFERDEIKSNFIEIKNLSNEIIKDSNEFYQNNSIENNFYLSINSIGKFQEEIKNIQIPNALDQKVISSSHLIDKKFKDTLDNTDKFNNLKKLFKEKFYDEININVIENLQNEVSKIIKSNALNKIDINNLEILGSKESIKDLFSNLSFDIDLFLEIIEKISVILSIEENYSIKNLENQIKFLKFISEVPKNILLNRRKELLDESNHDSINKYFEKILKIKENEISLESNYRIKNIVNIDEIKEDITIIKNAGFFSFLNSRYNQAKKNFLSIQRNKIKLSNLKIIHELQKIVSYFESIDDLNQDIKFNLLFASNYHEIKNNEQEIKAIVKFSTDVKKEFSNLGRFDETVKYFLLYSENDKLISLKDFVDNKNIKEIDYSSKLKKLEGNNDINEIKNDLKKLEDLFINFIKNIEEYNLNKYLTFNDLKEIYIHNSEILELQSTINENRNILNNTEVNYHNLESDKILTAIETIELILNVKESTNNQSLINFLFKNDFLHNYNLLNNFLININSKILKISQLYDDTNKLADINENAFFLKSEINVKNFEDLSLNEILKSLDNKIISFDELGDWITYQNAKLNNDELSINILIKAYEDNPKIIDYLTYAYKTILFQSLIRNIYEKYPHIKEFSGLEINNIRARFNTLDKKINNLHSTDLISTLTKRKPPSGVTTGLKRDLTEMGLINHLTQSEKPKIPSIRKVLERAGKAIKELKPVFMMSPHSVAQFLPPKGVEFDLILIDEASQLKPEFVMGALARCSYAAIMGDPMQLPPTSFYEREDDAEESEDFERLEEKSILDLALSRISTRRDLKWHYRSRDESLIAFSNKHFYNDRLILFPTASRDKSITGIQVKYIESVYKGKQNIQEAIEVVDSVCDYMSKFKNKSCLVVTMNVHQSELINSLISKKEIENQYVADYINDWKDTLEPFTVKNLENVQGDERDCIFISTVFGPPEKGIKPKQTFGPINTQYGHRRLNVLFTRAKEKVELVTSLQPGDILAEDDVSSGSRGYGRKILKDYIQYGLTGTLYSGEDTSREAGSDFQLYVGDKLKEKGYEITQEVGVAGFFIDIGVKHPKIPHKYLIGVECDGATYHSSKSARDRDRLRQEILEGLGWTLYRIWSTDWFNDPNNETDKLVDFIEKEVQKYTTN